MAKREVAVLPPARPSRPSELTIRTVTTDDQLIALWLHGRGVGTRRAYEADVAAFRDYVQTPLRNATLGDLQAFQDSLADMSTASQARKLSAVKSLLTFGQKTGYLVLNVGTPVRLPKIKLGLPRLRGRLMGLGGYWVTTSSPAVCCS